MKCMAMKLVFLVALQVHKGSMWMIFPASFPHSDRPGSCSGGEVFVFVFNWQRIYCYRVMTLRM